MNISNLVSKNLNSVCVAIARTRMRAHYNYSEDFKQIKAPVVKPLSSLIEFRSRVNQIRINMHILLQPRVEAMASSPLVFKRSSYEAYMGKNSRMWRE